MKILKNILTVVLLLLLCSLCVTCIIFLNSDTTSEDADLDLSISKEITYTAYSKVFLGAMDLKQFVKVEGVITNPSGDYIEEVQFVGNSDNLLISQGETFRAGDIIFKNGNEQYKAKFEGKVDRYYTSDKKITVVLSNYQDRIISASVPFQYAEYLSCGDNVTFLYNGVEQIGTISYVSTTVENGCVAVEIVFTDSDLSLLLNAPVEIIIIKASVENVIAVPQEALITSDNVHYVRIESDDGSDALVQVECGLISSDGYVEIISGLSEDSIVLLDKTTKSDPASLPEA